MSDNIIWAFPLLCGVTLAWIIGGAIGGAAIIAAYSVPDGLAFAYTCTLGAIPGVFWLFAFGWVCTGHWGAFWSLARGKTLDGGDW